MTFIPSTDRIADNANPVLDQIAGLSARDAGLVSFGSGIATLMLFESIQDQRTVVLADAAKAGVSRVEAEAAFDNVYDSLTSILSPRLDTIAEAAQAAQSKEFLAGLFEAMGIDPEAVEDEADEDADEHDCEADGCFDYEDAYDEDDNSLCGYGCCFEEQDDEPEAVEDEATCYCGDSTCTLFAAV